MKKILGDEFSFFGNGYDTLLPPSAAPIGFAAKPADLVFASSFLDDPAAASFYFRSQPSGLAALPHSDYVSVLASDNPEAVVALGPGSADRRPDDVFVSPIPGDPLHADLVEAATLMRLDQVRANPLFAGVDGHGQTVVIIDTGADLNHPFFGPDADSNGVGDRILFQFDFYGANDSDASDGNGHGTHVTGIVGSQDSTYKGMAPGTNFIILKALSDAGSGNTTDIAEAFTWVVNNRNTYGNIVAVSMSIGDSQNVNSDQATVISSQVQTLWNAGIATVIAAGNSYTSYNAPGVNGLAATPFAWGIASTLDNGNTFSSFSQRSSTMTEIAAPGSNITSSYLNGGTATLSGTSMATPMISGLVALAQDLSQEISGSRMTPTSILNIMRSTGVNITDGTTNVPRVDALNLMNGIVSFWQQSTNNPDNIYGWRGDDNLSGQGSDDVIRGNLGNDTIDGGTGTDRAIFAGLRSAYTLTPLSGDGVRVSGPDGIDTLSSVELLQFDDQTVTWPTGSVSINDVTISEGDSGTKLATFTVTRSGGTAAFAVNFATADGTATTADNDYVANSGTLNFGAGVNTQTISVTINGDPSFESNETFSVNLSGATNGAAISDSSGSGTITNDDQSGSVSINDVTITEGDSGTKIATFTVTRSGGAAPFAVNFATADGTATTADSDYVANSGTLNFGAGVNTQTISVTINGDAKVESDETFSVNLSAATNAATISDNSGAGSITNDDQSGSVSINDVTITEGDSGTKIATFTVTRSGGAAPFAVNFATADGTATTADNDYVANSGTLNFGAGINTQTISVTINGDAKFEANETFSVNLSAATNAAVISDSSGSGTITNDDQAGSVSINDVTITEGDSGTKIATFTVTRSGGTAAFAVNFATSDNTATVADHDYVANSGTLNFGAGVNTQTISVTINGDTRFESDEAFFVNLSGATNGATISDSQGIGTLSNDDHVPHDFNADSKSDVFLQNSNGSTYIWQMNGLGVAAYSAGQAVDASWHVVSTKSDLDADGRSDIVLQNTSGATYFWEMNGFGVKAFGAGPTVDPSWHIVGTGDLDADGKGDIVLQNTSGATYFWEMNGLGVKASGAGPTVDPSWHIAATGDLDGDGNSDIILQNTSGATYFWEMNGLGVKASGAGPTVDPSWHIVGTADLDGDGKSDIILQNTNGGTYFWEMNGLGVKAFGAGPTVDPSWHIAATGDLNADGKGDIILQNTSGATYFWEMDGLGVQASGAGPIVDPSWHII
jgi:hypothetical protein